MNDITYVVFGSWEDRFLDSALGIIRDKNPQKIVMFYYDSYADRTKDFRDSLTKLTDENKCSLIESELPESSPSSIWTRIEKIIETEVSTPKVVVDISTMPREVIWMIFWNLEVTQTDVDFTYLCPESYGNWLSRDPQTPRFVFKMSGICQFGKRAALVVSAGFDVERVHQLIAVFQPVITVIAMQEGETYPQNLEQVSNCRESFSSDDAVKFLEIDAYSGDFGESELSSQISVLLENYNVILSSLGPKPTAIALYKIQRKFPQVALAYAPSKEYSIDYSKGSKNRLDGHVYKV